MKNCFIVFFSLILMSQQCKDPAQKQNALLEVEDCVDPSKINKDAACIMIYRPVCGCDNITYSNDCVAQNQGLLTWTEGACGDSSDSSSIDEKL